VKAGRPRSKSNIVFSLMIMCGMILPVLAIPAGLEMFLLSYAKGDLEFADALKAALRMIVLMVATGLILLYLGKHLLKRLNQRESAIPRV
jgi:hypothetical protein